LRRRKMNWAFMTANYVARELDYTNASEWGKCHGATVNAFHGSNFSSKFEELVSTVKEIGFDAIELWVAHLDPLKATDTMLAKANNILNNYDVKVISYTAGFGSPGVSYEEANQIFTTAKAIGAPVLAQGFHPDNGEIVSELAEKYNIRVGLENHPEKSPTEVIEKVKNFYPWVGSAIDTGWFATQGYDPVQALRELEEYLVHVHLKDVKEVGQHNSCTVGDGIVDARGFLSALNEIGYKGYVTIEHEPRDYDPTEDVRKSLQRSKLLAEELRLNL
jgi:L-ribulose-5-phosphate 3-epimerase